MEMDVDRIPDRLGHDFLQIVPQHPDDDRLNAGVHKYYIFIRWFYRMQKFFQRVWTRAAQTWQVSVFRGVGYD